MDAEGRELNLTQDGLTEVTWRKDDKRRKSGPQSARPRQKFQQQKSDAVVVEDANSVSSELASWIKANAKNLKIRQKDRCWAAEMVNDFRENLLKFLRSNKDQPFFQSADFLNTGSYFEKVKIHSPDEFDMMLKLQAPSPLKMTALDSGVFYHIELMRPTRTPIEAFLLEDERTVSSSKILSEMYRLVRKFLKSYKVPDKRCRWEVNRKHPTSPAVTLSLLRTENDTEELISVDVVPALEAHPTQGWPPAARDGPDVGSWLGKKVRQEIKGLSCFFVPKRLKGRNLSQNAKESWRISFSQIEKKIIMCHGNTKTCCETRANKCCRKECLMLLKSLIESLKQCYPKDLDDLCSYHGKTTFFHTLSKRYSDSMWAHQRLPVCFLQLLGDLEDHARKGNLPHFFVPECNLFAPAIFPRKSLAFLVNALEKQRQEGLPLLKPPTPFSPWRPMSSAADAPSLLTTTQFLDTAFMIKLVLITVVLGFALSFVFKGE